MKNNYKISASGDSSITVSFGNEISPQINRYVMALDVSLKDASADGVLETIPAFCSLTVIYDAQTSPYEQMCKVLEKRIKKLKPDAVKSKKVHVIPVCYGGEFGDDMADVCAHTGLHEDEVIKLHTQPDYLIYMLGFLPGFAYLGGLNDKLVTPRLDSPRTVIPAGSVGIGGGQTGVYPLASPGGWRLIGRTPLKPYDAERENAFLYQAGDYIRFTAVNRNEYEAIEKAVKDGTYEHICEEVK